MGWTAFSVRTVSFRRGFRVPQQLPDRGHAPMALSVAILSFLANRFSFPLFAPQLHRGGFCRRPRWRTASGQSAGEIVGASGHSFPLLFARNLLNYDLSVVEMGVQLTWGGLEKRSLLELGANRVGFFADRKATEPEWQKEIGVHHGSDVVADAREVALDLFRHFGWQPPGDALATLERDLRSLVNGIFPD